MKQGNLKRPYLICGLGQIQFKKPIRGWILAISFWDCVGIGIYFLFSVNHPLGIPIGLLCVLLAGLLWLYSYLDYLDLVQASKASLSNPTTNTYELGRVSFLRGELPEARTHFEKALSQNPTDWDALYQLARVQLELGEKKSAQRLFERYIEEQETRKWQREAEEYLAQLKNEN